MKGTLSCTATNCVNNMSGICSASTINISGVKAYTTEATQCETFSQKGLKNSINNVLNMNVVGEIKQVFNNDTIEMSPSIRCDAINCMHNSKKICAAENIMVNGIGAVSSVKTECETFKEK
ncbi:DUF1540 domain-containing protein [Clostridium psychrophilum]|uniref:DUF1540 domain-containing protein n=1 Tax=Clostridium psychrophilum TaxID=132926 RepID=UPI001C0C4FD3|nr:DUF1540 domain-containing protein [Clostridium psychrophilum]MBU3179668.1 DUF1540 domain-containing protein [Clostridium psychrophilum]